MCKRFFYYFLTSVFTFSAAAHDISFRAEIIYTDNLPKPKNYKLFQNLKSANVSMGNVTGNDGEYDPKKFNILKGGLPHKGQTFITGASPHGYRVRFISVKLPDYKSSWHLKKSNGSIRVNIGEIRGVVFVVLSSQNLMAGAAGNPGQKENEASNGIFLTFKLPFPVYLEPNKKYGIDISIAPGSQNYFEWAGTKEDSFRSGEAYIRRGLEVSEVSGDRFFRFGVEVLKAPRIKFQHPGTLHSQEDLDRMKQMIEEGKEPWKSSFELFKKSPWTNKGWPAHPVETIVRGVGRQNYTRVQLDGQVMYELALMWHLTGDEKCAEQAVYIANSWPAKLKGLGGNSNVSLAAGIVGYLFAVGADLLSTYPGWKEKDLQSFKEMMVRVFYNANHDFLYRKHDTFKRFGGNTHYRLNWDACNIASMAAIGILCDNKAIFRQALEFFAFGSSNGRLERSAWYIHPNGMAQTEEMGRDQPHNLFGWYCHLLTCQMAWNQGIDLFAYDDFRVLRAVEYITKYNLGFEVLGVYHRNTTLKNTERVSAYQRSKLIPMHELVLSHYVHERGMSAPYSEMAAKKMRPEPFPNLRHHPSQADWFGLGTLTFTQSSKVKPSKPQSLKAHWSASKISLNWLGSAGAESYSVWRSEAADSKFKKIATVKNRDLFYLDSEILNGKTYFYKVSAEISPNQNLFSDVIEVKQKLKSLYSFEGNCQDLVGGKNGKEKGGATGKISYSEGVTGQAANFDGIDDFIQLPKGIANFQDITIAAWVYWRGGRPWQRIFDFGSEIEKYMMLTPSNGNEMRFQITTSRGTEGTGTLRGPELPENKWIHIAVTLNGDTGTLYVDGKKVDSQTINEVDPLFSQIFCYLGRSMYAQDPYFNGKIDDFRIYNYGLSSSEIYQVYKILEK